MERISQLLYKHLEGTLSEAERTELNEWAAANPANRKLLDRVNNNEVLEADIDDWYAIPRRTVADDPRLDAAILQHETTKNQPRVRQLVRRILPYAAAVFFILLAGMWYVSEQRQTSREQEIAATDIRSGGNKATLTLSDGRKIDLSSEQSEIIVKDESVTYGDGSSLAVIPDKSKDRSDVSLLQLTTPKGGTYQLILPDGSRVWLNTGSTIKYPARFISKERTVEISGEAYFDIEEDSKRPFKVLSPGQEVLVLGTKFNVSAYPDDRDTKTTLVDGKVLLSLPKGSGEGFPASGKSILLAPGEQASLSKGHITKSKVDVSQFTAWKEGFFYFNKLPVTTAITQLARWYNLDVVYQEKLPESNVYAYIDRDKPLSAVLKALELSRLKFKIVQQGERKQLIVLGEQ
ncbi:FecR domain-containing protein [Arcticibacter tournemirensis]|uniref:DUF4974 domain-containing protein n=1 Tax=Arcticibacter tournemirensis TaxID=699437 RepID=A0A4Q0M373_9SPHI|nr:FecR domain-containing protein [Arcticibacter tournemirensis]RXF67347.1 DUF4974 domain-containing protein [Arcticibacter tournemirensis]